MSCDTVLLSHDLKELKMAAPVHRFVCLFLIFVSCTYAWIPRFINGRPKGGMLGAPRVSHPVVTATAQWYTEQRLDHFDGANTKVWSQVSELKA